MQHKNLIEACCKNERKSQEELYNLYKGPLYRLCLKYSRNREEAEDVLHDAFIIIFKTIHKYKGKGSFEGWMKRITINKAIDKFKQAPFKSVPVNEEVITNLNIDSTDISIPLEVILNSVQELPTQYQLVFNLYELDSFSHKEIAKLLGISVSTSKSNLHRAKVILKEKLTVFNSPIKKTK